MKTTIEQKALAACRASAAAAKEIARIKQVIGDSLSACHDEFAKQFPDDHPIAWKPHLADAYEPHDVEETQYSEGERVYLDDEEQLEILAKCPHCMVAHNAIQARKAARKQLGAARRAITMIGRVA